MSIVVRVLDAAEATGHLNNTVVFYTSDHGEMSLEHRQDYKNNLREPSTRVPFIIAPFNVPSLAGAPLGSVVTDITSHIDVLPTLLDLAGVPSTSLPPSARGSSLLPFLVPPTGRSAAQRAALASRKPYAAAEYHSNLANTGSFMLRTQAYKLITFGHTYPWFAATNYTSMLFDEDADP
jgi:arylsulfatase A-like enzyme